MSQKKSDSAHELPRLSRRSLLAGAGAALGASMLSTDNLLAQNSATAAQSVVFTHTTVITNDAQRRTLRDVALAVQGDRIAAIGDTDTVLAQFPDAEIYDGSRKA